MDSPHPTKAIAGERSGSLEPREDDSFRHGEKEFNGRVKFSDAGGHCEKRLKSMLDIPCHTSITVHRGRQRLKWTHSFTWWFMESSTAIS